MEHFHSPPRSPFEGQGENNLASERLRKAIERNRAKQRRRATQPSQGNIWDGAADTKSVRTGTSTANTVKFSTDIEASRPRSQVPVQYISAKRKVRAKKRKSSSTLPKWLESTTPIEYFVKACWIFAFILLGRLIISSGGVVDYYSKRALIDQKIYERDSIIEENVSLVHEIDSILNDQAYQRKLVRDHLGFIAKDEYLILFHQGRQSSSI